MKKCSYCDKEIHDKAITCKYCNSIQEISLKGVGKKIDEAIKGNSEFLSRKTSGKHLLVLLGLFVFIILSWQGILPIVAIWCFLLALGIWYFCWKKTKMNRKKKLVISAIVVGVILVIWIISAYRGQAPTITIVSPENGYSIQAKDIYIKGKVKPSKSVVSVNGMVLNLSSGEFSYKANLKEEKNVFNFNVVNNEKTIKTTITINRIFTETEINEMERQEAIKQAILKEEEERRRAEQIAYERTKAGQLCKKHSTWAKDECQKVADNKIWIGMSISMLKAERGLPGVANPSNYGSGTQWQWCWWNYTPSCFYDNDGDMRVDSFN